MCWGYAEACRGGKCFIVKLRNSTAELSDNGYVRQHKGYENGIPPEADRSLLDRWMRQVVEPKQEELRIAAEAAAAEAAAAERISLLEANAQISLGVSEKLRTMTHMAACCLYRCQGLVTLDIPDTIKVIDFNAISECWQLESIRLPKGVKFNELFFIGLVNLKRIYCSEEQAPVLRRIVAFEKQRSVYMKCPKDIEICITE